MVQTVKESACQEAGNPGLIPGSRRSPGEGNGYPLQYSFLENPRGQRSLAGSSPWGCKEFDTTQRLMLSFSKSTFNNLSKDKLYRAIVIGRLLRWASVISVSCPPPGDLPDSGIEPSHAPALAGSFFTTNATWEALRYPWHLSKPLCLSEGPSD